MNIVTVETTLEQRAAAKEAALLNYEDKKNTPDRAGWKGGKCPVTEYRGKVGELGAANFLGVDWHELCLFSTNPADYTKPDLGEWEVKSGSTFSRKDIAKGAKYILWVNPWNTGEPIYCHVDTCKTRIHQRLSGTVEILGWTDLDDLSLCADFGGYYKPTGDAFRNINTLGDAA